MTLELAACKAVENYDSYVGGPVIVKDGSEYDAIPRAYLTDISYSGSKNVIYDVRLFLDRVDDLYEWAEDELVEEIVYDIKSNGD